MIGVIDYEMGNVRSVLNALEHLGAEAELVGSPAEAERAEKLILPGVGAFGAGMRQLDRRGFAEELPRLTEDGRPLLAICLGMQLLAARGTEHGEHPGLGMIPGTVERLAPPQALRIPHVGWNELELVRPSALFEGLTQERSFYFVHSFEFRPDSPEAVTATAPYGTNVTACVEHGHVYGVQFHPEKSQVDGLALLDAFLALD
jgi:glutamine amidotransferase